MQKRKTQIKISNPVRKLPQPKISQSMQSAFKAYDNEVKKGAPKLPEMEALRPYLGKRGVVSKRATRSQKARREFKEAKEAVKRKYGEKPSKTKIKADQKQKAESQKAVLKKKIKKIRRKAAQEARKEAKKSGKAKPEEKKKLKKIAQQAMCEAEEKYSRMLDIFTKGSQKTLQSRVRYELYKQMIDQGINDSDIEKFVDKILQSLNDLPQEAVKLAQNDDFTKVLMHIVDLPENSRDDFNAMVKAYVMGESDDVEYLTDAIDYWQENNPNNMGFQQFWEEASGHNMDPDTWSEILGVFNED